MIGLFGFLFFIVIVAALSLGIAFLLDNVARNLGWKKRAVLAGFLGPALPMSIAIFGVLPPVVADENALVAISRC